MVILIHTHNTEDPLLIQLSLVQSLAIHTHTDIHTTIKADQELKQPSLEHSVTVDTHIHTQAHIHTEDHQVRISCLKQLGIKFFLMFYMRIKCNELPISIS